MVGPKQMPSNFRSLTNTSQEENMVQEPNLDTFVVCRAKDDIGLVQIGEVNLLLLTGAFAFSLVNVLVDFFPLALE